MISMIPFSALKSAHFRFFPQITVAPVQKAGVGLFLECCSGVDFYVDQMTVGVSSVCFSALQVDPGSKVKVIKFLI